MNSKNASVNEIKAVLRKIISSESTFTADVLPVADAVQFPPPATNIKVEEIKEVAADSTATVVEAAYDNYYDIIKDKENLYKLKATKEAVYTKWKKVLDNLKNDKEFVQILKAELSNTGFSSKLFVKDNYNSTNLDFEMLDYVFANYNLFSNPPIEAVAKSVNVEATTTAYEPYYYEQDIDTALNTYFSTSNFPENPQFDKVLKYYKKYLEVSDYNATGVQNYLSAVKLNIDFGNNQKEYLETFENYFNSIVKSNTSIIENLDAAFSNDNQTNYSDWTGYKNNFANLANDVSWYLVEKSNDSNYIKKAIHWSEISLIIEKNNHYYLDTLAQLYYKNGDKEKAIVTEQKAIEFSEKIGQVNEDYKIVLQKMKDGTY
jgi:hypothetical protein